MDRFKTEFNKYGIPLLYIASSTVLQLMITDAYLWTKRKFAKVEEAQNDELRTKRKGKR